MQQTSSNNHERGTSDATEEEIKAVGQQEYNLTHKTALESASPKMKKIYSNLDKLKARWDAMVSEIDDGITQEYAALVKADAMDNIDVKSLPKRPFNDSEMARLESLNVMIHSEKVKLRDAKIEHYQSEMVRIEKEQKHLDEAARPLRDKVRELDHEHHLLKLQLGHTRSLLGGQESAQFNYTPIHGEGDKRRINYMRKLAIDD